MPIESLVSQKGNEKFKLFLKNNGGYIPIEQAAKLLNLNESEVGEMVKMKQLIQITLDDTAYYPCFQFHQNKIIPHLDVILNLLAVSHFVEQCMFFLTPSVDLGHKSVIRALKDNTGLAIIKKQAHQYCIHGAR